MFKRVWARFLAFFGFGPVQVTSPAQPSISGGATLDRGDAYFPGNNPNVRIP